MLYPAQSFQTTPRRQRPFCYQDTEGLHGAGMKRIGDVREVPTLCCLAFQISAAVRYLIFVRPLVSRQQMRASKDQKPPDLRRLLRSRSAACAAHFGPKQWRHSLYRSQA